MTTELTVNEPVRLESRRCWDCGRWWAYERFQQESPECPVGGGRANDRLRELVSELERRVASLRGAVTRAKGGRR